MYTLIASVFGGRDWAENSDLLWSLEHIYGFVFAIYVVFTHMALLNLVTGIFIECSMNAAMQDKQMALQEQMMRQGLHRR